MHKFYKSHISFTNNTVSILLRYFHRMLSRIARGLTTPLPIIQMPTRSSAKKVQDGGFQMPTNIPRDPSMPITKNVECSMVISGLLDDEEMKHIDEEYKKLRPASSWLNEVTAMLPPPSKRARLGTNASVLGGGGGGGAGGGGGGGGGQNPIVLI
jgi:hypothetical protein